MPVIRSQVVFEAKSGIPADRAMNTFHFSHPFDDPSDADFAAIGAALAAFYIADPYPADPLYGPVMNLMSSQSVGGATPKVWHYILDENGDGGSPDGYSELIGGFAPPATPGLPAEVALTLSFAAELDGIEEVIPGGVAGPKGDTKPRSSRRGRIYLPFLNTGVMEATGDGVRPKETALYTLMRAGTHLRDDAGLFARDIYWAVYSKKDGQARTVVDVSCDNAFDTQRRRGMEKTVRIRD